MKSTYTIFSALVALTLMTAPLSVVRAHGDETHETKAEAVAHEKKEAHVMSVDEMKQMITMLRQLIALIVEQKRIKNAPAPSPAAHTEMETHHEEHAAATTTTTVATEEKKLVIEVEKHFDKTHVHARYVDKAEEMFFVEAALTDETALIAAIVAKTGLSTDVVKAALKYL